ncbi:restriction endonuclease [Streptomyces sp. NBC_01264]|uniref:restriction endonuclease n=1 Tax=Streptomyces sp. NBC_01264 TaxID=2903804 RepID=UPI00224CE3BC|nr:restriction endonuclease [Streptomyces sp. NBC_01264]MCX4782247.1 restriction endonuclease [Streptomyces sp. NBC_01264]
MTLPGEGGRKAGGGSAPFGRDVVLAVGLAGICFGGLAVFLKATAGAWALPLATALVLAVGVMLAKWSVSPVRRRSTAPPAPVPALHGDPYPAEVTAVPDVPAAGGVPDVGSGALDHAAADADGFEHAIAALCARDGCTPVEVVGGAGDLGADVIATTPDGLRVVVQCKHYADTHRVGSQDLQRFGGTCFAVHGADVAVVVTTSSYTTRALEYAAACGIVCVDGEALAAWTESAVAPPWESDSRDAAERVATA